MFSDQKLLRSILMLTIVFFGCLASVKAQAVSFTYQGSLKDGAVPANGNFDFQFTVFNSLSGGTPISTNFLFSNVPVTNGIFSVKIVSGINPFLGGSGFMEIRVGPGGGATTLLTPRQEITNVPFSILSIKSQTADNAITLGGIAANQYVTTTGGGTNFVQNSTTQQPTSNFNISGNGKAGGTLTGNIVSATTQFNIGTSRVLFASPFNIFGGGGAGFSNSTGILNAFFGSSAGETNTTGDANSFFGRAAGMINTTGPNNSFFGFEAGRNNTRGFDNSFFGSEAGKLNQTGDGNTIVGGSADVGSIDLDNAGAIGFRSFVTQSNSLVLGSISGINSASANTFVGIGTTAPTAKLTVGGFGAFNVSSAARFDLFNSVFGMGYLQHVTDTGLWQISTTDGQTKMVITASGNIGINVNAPNDRLDVGGII